MTFSIHIPYVYYWAFLTLQLYFTKYKAQTIQSISKPKDVVIIAAFIVYFYWKNDIFPYFSGINIMLVSKKATERIDTQSIIIIQFAFKKWQKIICE